MSYELTEAVIKSAASAATRSGRPDYMFMSTTQYRRILKSIGYVFTNFEWAFYLDLMDLVEEGI